MSYGIPVPMDFAPELCTRLEAERIEYLVWNFAETLKGAPNAEIEFDSLFECERAQVILSEIKKEFQEKELSGA